MVKILLASLLIASLSACVTQQYKEDKTLIINNSANKEEVAMTRISLGLGYLKMGNTTQAKLNLEKAKRVAPNLPQVYTAFAHYYDSVGEPKQAIDAYEKALSIKSDDADTLNNYGVFLCRQGHIEQAEKQLLKAINVPSYLLVSQSYENIALCQLKNSHFIKAEKYLKKAIEHNPNNVSALINMARLQYAKGDYKAAENHIKRFEKATRRFTPEPLTLAFKIYQKLGRRKAAQSYAAMLVRMYPNAYQAKQYLLNGLEHSEVDGLAATYKKAMVSQRRVNLSTSKKRVIKLSPKKANYTQQNQIAKQPENLNNKMLLKENKQMKNRDISRATIAENRVHTLPIAKPLPTEHKRGAQIVSLTDNNDNSNKFTQNKGQKVSRKENEFVADNTSPLFDDKERVAQANKEIVEDFSPASQNNETTSVRYREEKTDRFIAPDLFDEKENHAVSEQEIEQLITNDLQSDDDDNKKTDNEVIYYQLEDLPIHKVRSGENLFKISKKYNIRIRTLRKWNNLTEHSILRVGDTIYLADPNSVVTK